MNALALQVPTIIPLNRDRGIIDINIQNRPIEDRVKLLIIRDLLSLNWQINFQANTIEISPPTNYDKSTIKHAMSLKRSEILLNNKAWIDKHIDLGRNNLANGRELLNSKIEPIIEVCETAKQHRLFRLYRYYWSSPYSDYVGRRIKLIIRDKGLPGKPVIGIAALGSPIIHIPERDDFIGWDKQTRTKNLIYTMDAYVIGALPPYNYLLGGKLLSYVLATNEVRAIYRNKYKDKITLLEKRKAHQLAGIFTTSLYGRSSQYNRLRLRDKLLYQPIGETKGYGTLHLSEETISAMSEFIKSRGIIVANEFGDGPSWTMRVIRQAGDLLGFDSDFLLKHSFRRNIYFVPLAKNYKEFLNGETRKIMYHNYTLKEVSEFWHKRWLENRIQNQDIMNDVLSFKKANFIID